MSKWMLDQNLHDLGSGTTLVTGPAANWLIVRDGGAYTLIDCGYPGDTSALEASLEASGVKGLPEAVVITHAHGDHIGNLPHFIDAGVPIHLAAAEIPNITGSSREQIGPKESLPRAARSPGWLKWCIHAIRVGGLKDHTVPADGLTPFTDETVLDIPGALRPVATTGHTSGHTSYLIGDTGVLAAGDAVVTGHLTLKASGVPQMLPTPFHHNPIGAELTASRMLSGVDFDVLATGHGPLVRVPDDGHLVIR